MTETVILRSISSVITIRLGSNYSVRFMPVDRPLSLPIARNSHSAFGRISNVAIAASRPSWSFVAPTRFSKADVRWRGPSTIGLDSGRSRSLAELRRPAVFVGFAMATGTSHPENIIEVFLSAADLTSTPLSGANIA
jgi:hypothetical protein